MKLNQIFTTILALVFICSNISALAQTDTLFLSVEQAIKMAVTNNPDLKRVRLANDLLESQIKGAKSAGLPQINGSVRFTDNYSIAQQLLPGEIFGQSGQIPVQFGTRYGLTAGIEVNQIVYSREYKTNLRKLGATQQIIALQTLATMEDLVYNVAQIYIQYQTTIEQEKLLDANIERVNNLIRISNAQYENGIIKKLDVDQIRVNRTNLLAEKSNLKIALDQQLNYLRFYLDLDQITKIILTEKMDNTSRYPLSKTLLLNENINYRILQNQLSLTAMEEEVIKAGFYPTLSVFAQFNYSGQANKLNLKADNFTDFTSGLWGLNLTVPIFDGYQKKNRIAENKIKFQQEQLDLQTLENATELEYNNAIAQIQQNEKLIATQLENMDLATEVYEITKLSYQEGVAPLTELLNAETGLKEAQSQYLTALINYKLAELDHVKASGQLAQLLKLNN